jgi:hypothetical protein
MLEGFCFATTNKEQADKDTRKETTKITKENSRGTKHKWKTCRV